MNLISTITVLVMVATFLAAAVRADVCGTPLNAEKVCLYGNNPSLIGAGLDSIREGCASINDNPFVFAPAPVAGGPSASQCEEFVRADGSACVTFTAEYACSSNCQLCLHLPCQYFCANHANVCPTATAGGCFASIQCLSGTAGNTCTQWHVDSSKIPKSTAVTSITTVTTSATGTDNLSSASALILDSVKLLLVMLVLVVIFE